MPRVKTVPVFDEYGCMQVNKGNQIMKYTSKIKLTGDDFVAVGMNYNYFMIPRLAYPEKNLKVLKQQILENQSLVGELKKLWDDKENPAFINKTLDIMEKYFEK